jgi:hypothetical protein
VTDEFPAVKKLLFTKACKMRLAAFYGHTDDTICSLENNTEWVVSEEKEDGYFRVQMKNKDRSRLAFVCVKTEGIFLALGLTRRLSDNPGPSAEEQAKISAEKQAKRDANRRRDEDALEKKKKEKAQRAEQLAKEAKEKADLKEKRRAEHEAKVAEQMAAKQERKRKAEEEGQKTQWTAAQKAAYWAEQATKEQEQRP